MQWQIWRSDRSKTSTLEESEADVIIHTAAISDVGICEKIRKSPIMQMYFFRFIWQTHQTEERLICFSSDQVYRGCESDGPYREDEAKPANIYGAHKLEMEQRVLDRQPDSVMLRAEWMYDYISPRGNYLLNVLNAKKRRLLLDVSIVGSLICVRYVKIWSGL